MITLSWLDRRIIEIKKMEQYITKQNRVKARKIFYMDSNENTVIPLSFVKKAVSKALSRTDIRMYPDDAYKRLSLALSKLHNIPCNCFVPCNGSDQAIELLCNTFLKEGDVTLVVDPSFSMYSIKAIIAGGKVEKVRLNKDFSLKMSSMKKVAKKACIVFLCSPNNPTGNSFPIKQIMDILDETNGLVVVDEAYADFSGKSVIYEIPRRKNLVILRTFSKAYGIAGLRLGYIACNPNVAYGLRKVQDPYPVNSLAIETALIMLENFNEIKRWVEEVKKEREFLYQKLSSIKGIKPFRSEANFILFSILKKGKYVWKYLEKEGFRVRYFTNIPGANECIRVTVANRKTNMSFIEKVKEVMNS
jgi:histidinol-phosphate aminotransferase